MTLPAQVLLQSEKAKSLQEEYSKVLENPDVEDAKKKNQAATTTPEQVVENKPTELPAVDWEQKYKSLQGMYNSQVPKLQSELKLATQQLEELRKAVEAKATEGSASPSKYVTDHDLETFDEDTIDLIRRAAREEAEGQFLPLIQKLQAQIQSLQTTVVPKVTRIEHDTTVSKTDRFMRELDGIVPQWRTLNNYEPFLQWLDEPDPLTGKPRQMFLDEAVAEADSGRAGRFFLAFMEATNQTVPTQKQPSASNVSQSLESMVVPGRGREAPLPNEKPTITRQYIADFYNDVSRGVYRNRASEKAKIEAEIFAAKREGRVI